MDDVLPIYPAELPEYDNNNIAEPQLDNYDDPHPNPMWFGEIDFPSFPAVFDCSWDCPPGLTWAPGSFGEPGLEVRDLFTPDSPLAQLPLTPERTPLSPSWSEEEPGWSPQEENDARAVRLVGIHPNPGPLADLLALLTGQNVHGNYTGSAINGEGFVLPPVDRLDAAAQRHDLAYSGRSHVAPMSLGSSLLADAKLAKDALFEGPTGAFVSTGMSIKMVMDALNGRPSFDPQVQLKTSQAGARQRLVGVELNPGPKTVAAKTLQPSERVSETVNVNLRPRNGRAKAQTGPTTQMHSKRGAQMPFGQSVVQGVLAANSLQSITTMRPEYVELSSRGDMRKVRITMTLGYINTSTLSEIPGSVIYSAVVNKNLFMGSLAEQDFSNFERWAISGASMTFIPSVASSTPGSIVMYADPDSADVNQPGVTINPSTYASHRGVVKHTIWAGGISAKAYLNTSLLFTDVDTVVSGALNPAMVGSSTENRLYSAGVLNLVSGENISTVGPIGELFFTAVLTFTSHQVSELGKLICTLKCQCGAGNGVAAPANGTYPLIPFFNTYFNTATNQNRANNGAVETVYNPGFLNNSNGMLALPIGNYSLYAQIGLNAYTSVGMSMTWGPSGNPTYSGNIHVGRDSTTPTGSQIVELATAATGALNSNAGVILIAGQLRVTSPSTGGANCGLFFPVITLSGTNTFTMAGMLISIFRSPGFDTSPLANLFPLGNYSLFGLKQRLLNRVASEANSHEERKEAPLVTAQDLITLRRLINELQPKMAVADEDWLSIPHVQGTGASVKVLPPSAGNAA